MRILLAEDDPAVAELARIFLEDLDHTITVVPSVAAALQAIGEATPQLVLTNIELAGPTGGEQLVLYLRSSDIPVILFTGYARSSAVVKWCLGLGAAAYLEKPFAPDSLCEMVNRFGGVKPTSGKQLMPFWYRPEGTDAL